MKKLLLSCLIMLTGIITSFAQQVDFDKKSGLITVDGRPSFYLTGKNRVLFQSDYSLENLQHQELAYLKAEQQRIYSPGYGYTTETYFSVTFSASGNYCELHGLNGFSMFKALAKNIAAARLIQNDMISKQAEQKYIVMNNGVFFRDPNDRGRGDGGYDGPRRDDRRRDDDRRNDRGSYGRDAQMDDRAGRDDRRGTDDRRDDRTGRDDRRGNDDRGDVRGDDRRDDNRNDTRDNSGSNSQNDNADDAPRLPVKVSIANNKIFDNAELIGNYTQTKGSKGETIITIFDTEKRKIATATRTTADWKLTMIDDVKLTSKYDKTSPLINLFTFIVEKEYL